MAKESGYAALDEMGRDIKEELGFLGLVDPHGVMNADIYWPESRMFSVWIRINHGIG